MMAERARCCVLALMGLPGAGKSSLARALCEEAVGGTNVVHVCFDEFINEAQLAGRAAGEGTGAGGGDDGFDGQLWKDRQDGRTAACSRVDEVLLEHSAGGKGVVVVADDNLYYRSMRRPLFQLARMHGAAYVQCFVQAAPNTAQARNAQREGRARVPEGTIERMAGLMEEPAPEAHLWELATVHVWTDGGGVAEAGGGAAVVRWAEGEPVAGVASALEAAWGPAPDLAPTEEELAARLTLVLGGMAWTGQREAGSAANAASAIHGLDVRSRKALSQALASAAGLPSQEKAAAAKRLNDERKALLARARRLGELLTEDDARVIEETFAALCLSVGP